MKQLDPSLTKDYRPVVVYSDDLTRIVEPILDCDAAIEISTDEYRFDSVDELRNHAQSQRLRSLSLKSATPYISLDLRPWKCSLHVGSSRVEGAGVFWKIDSVLRRCERPLAWMYSGPALLVITILGPLIFVPAIELDPPVGVALSGLWLAFLLWNFRVGLYSHSLVVLRPRGSTGVRGFLARNRDQLLLALISALLGLAVGIIATLLGT